MSDSEDDIFSFVLLNADVKNAGDIDSYLLGSYPGEAESLDGYDVGVSPRQAGDMGGEGHSFDSSLFAENPEQNEFGQVPVEPGPQSLAFTPETSQRFFGSSTESAPVSSWTPMSSGSAHQQSPAPSVQQSMVSQPLASLPGAPAHSLPVHSVLQQGYANAGAPMYSQATGVGNVSGDVHQFAPQAAPLLPASTGAAGHPSGDESGKILPLPGFLAAQLRYPLMPSGPPAGTTFLPGQPVGSLLKNEGGAPDAARGGATKRKHEEIPVPSPEVRPLPAPTGAPFSMIQGLAPSASGSSGAWGMSLSEIARHQAAAADAERKRQER